MTLVLQQYGITLKRLKESDIELVRTWRNHPEIRKHMAYRKTISASMQKKWFERVNNLNNYYFLIHYNGEDIGVINCKEVNIKEKYGEGGIFIWNEMYRNSPVPVFASLILLDFIFNEVKIGELSFVRVLSINQRAISYNEGLGYVKVPYQHGESNPVYVLSKEVYNRKAVKLRIAAKNYTQTDGNLVVKGDVSDLNINQLNDYLKELGR